MPRHNSVEVAWSPAEDRLLLALVVEQRNPSDQPAWKAISQKLNEAGFDRTPQMARCRHLRIRRGNAQKASGKAKNYCKLCGQLRSGHLCTATRAPAPPDRATAAAAAAMQALSRQLHGGGGAAGASGAPP